MSTTITELQVVYQITEADIAARLAKYGGLTADTPQGYKAVQSAIGDLRDARVSIEKRRKELKADSLEYGRKVDAVAKFLTEKIEAIELPLKALKAAVDEEKARAKAEKEAAERRALEESLRAEREALNAEAERLRVEAERLAAERAALRPQAVLTASPAEVPAAAPPAAEPSAETVTIPMSRYKELLRAEEKLLALEEAGVNSWGGYADAVKASSWDCN